jgi:ABC-2 type transport system permease protein
MSAAFLSTAMWIAAEELRLIWRKRVAASGFVLLFLLTLLATMVSLQQKQVIEEDRAKFQATADQHWDAQPDRHPHRVVHYGHFVFRPLEPLSFFDFGVEPYTGRAIYLEGHRQNSANFSDARQSSLLLRFGQLTPAFVLQTLVPLLIVFLAFGSVARERENGQMRLVLCQGVAGIRFLVGKIIGHSFVALVLSAPALIVLVMIGILSEGAGLASLMIILGYSLYFFIWVIAAVLISAAVPRARDALLLLVGCWIATVILLPRVLPAIASENTILPTRIETDVAIHKALSKIGDSHNSNDPYFSNFRKQILAKYGVSRVEDIPVNYGGLLLAEGERLTSELFDRYMQADFRTQDEQSAFIYGFGVASPVIALRRLSMALTATSRGHHEHFLVEAEKYRFSLIQALNDLHAREVLYENDRAQRLDRNHWQHLPKFSYTPLSLRDTINQHVLPGIGVLALWLGSLIVAVFWLGKRLERLVK